MLTGGEEMQLKVDSMRLSFRPDDGGTLSKVSAASGSEPPAGAGGSRTRGWRDEGEGKSTAIIAEGVWSCQQQSYETGYYQSVRLLSHYHGCDVAALVFLAEGGKKIVIRGGREKCGQLLPGRRVRLSHHR